MYVGLYNTKAAIKYVGALALIGIVEWSGLSLVSRIGNNKR
jgi:hypothetical protein